MGYLRRTHQLKLYFALVKLLLILIAEELNSEEEANNDLKRQNANAGVATIIRSTLSPYFTHIIDDEGRIIISSAKPSPDWLTQPKKAKDKDKLTAEITEDDVRKAIIKSSLNKAPGPDHIPVLC
eukprot:TRINITY_DN1020_c2_g1_i2.p1 TRINITY_DN1020_c2_g1~~TRINITY_DN1020_c2_g1_i2.p1  ORF type:complete len:125 (+),score=10.67 TRINITY_DN1020_c2_g1_i2:210-584(+)